MPSATRRRSLLRALDPDWQRRVALEAEVLANLHHVNVVRAIARGRTPEGQPYVVLELVEGQSLRARLDGGGPILWREVIETPRGWEAQPA